MKTLPVILLAILGAATAQPQSNPSALQIYPSGEGVPLNTKILVQPACCTYSLNAPVTLTTGGQPVDGAFEYIEYRWLIFTPAQPLRPNTAYAVTVRMPDRAATTGTFTTGATSDSTPPRLLSSSPANGESSLALGQPVLLRFSEPLHPKQFTANPPRLLDLVGGFPLGAFSLDNDPRVLRFSPRDLFAPGRLLAVQFLSAFLEDLNGNRLNALPSVSFNTYPAAPKDGARLTGSVPQEAETGVPTNPAIVLAFDRPILTPSNDSFTLASDADPNVALNAEISKNQNTVILRPQTLLRGNQRYTLSLRALGDAYGVALAPGPVLTFSTAALPQSLPFSQLAAPLQTMPHAGTLRWSFSRAVHPLLLPALANSRTGLEIPLRLLEDGVTIEASLPEPGEYFINGQVCDRLAAKPISSYPSSITVSATPDTKPPAVLATFPAHQSTGIPPEAVPSIAFDEPVYPLIPGQVRLWQDTTPLEIKISCNGSSCTIAPKAQFIPNADYRIEIHGASDYAGNLAADIAWSFHVDPAPPAESFILLQSEPAHLATAVSTGSPLAFTFNHPPNPVSLSGSYCGVSVSGQSVPGRWQVDGARASFHPSQPLPASSKVDWRLCGSDIYGSSISGNNASGYFWTTGGTPPPPRVVAITPAAGEPAVTRTNAITLQFNQALLAASVSSSNLLLTPLSGQLGSYSVSYDAANYTAAISLSSAFTGVVQLFATSGITGLGGAPLEPFSALVRIDTVYSWASPPSPSEPRFLRSAQISGNSSTATAARTIVAYFLRPMDRALAEQGFRVVTGTGALPGRIEWTPDHTALTFYPSSPLPTGSPLYVTLSLVPWQAAGADSISIRVPDSPYPTPPVVWNYYSDLSYNAIVELAFDHDMPATALRSAVARSTHYSTGEPDGLSDVPLAISQRTPRIFRLTPGQEFPKPRYRIEIVRDDGSSLIQSFARFDTAVPSTRLHDAGPTEEMGDIPLNAVVWLKTHTQLNPFTIQPLLVSGGQSVPFSQELLDNGKLIRLRPLGLLRGNADYSVDFPGLEDMAGRPLPIAPWSFHTGAGPDLSPTTITSVFPTGPASPNTAFTATLGKPSFFVREFGSGSQPESFDFSISADGIRVDVDVFASAAARKLTFMPRRPWPVGSSADLSSYLNFIQDWTGAPIVRPSAQPVFNITAGPDLPPAVAACNPLPGAAGVPLNVRIQARFDTGVLESSLAGATLSTSDASIPVLVSLAADGLTATIASTQPLQPSQTYTVTLPGVLSTAGIQIGEPFQWSFTTSNSALPAASSGPVFVRATTDPPSFLLLHSRPFNPVSVSSSTVRLAAGSVVVVADLKLEDDARSLRLTPRIASLPPGSISVSTENLYDIAGWPVAGAANSALSASGDGSAPLALVKLLPEPGSTVTWNISAAASFNRRVWLRDGSAGLQISQNGNPVPASYYLSDPFIQPSIGLISFAPQWGWLPGANYEVSIAGVIDAFGHQLDPIAFSFTTSPDGAPTTTANRILSLSPLSSAVGVPVDSPVIMELLHPSIINSGFYPAGISVSPQPAVSPRASFDRNILRIEPVPAWKAGQAISLATPVRSLYGNSSTFYTLFTTAAPQDREPPRVDSVQPAPGSRLPAGPNDFYIRFSEAVAPVSYLDFATLSCGGSSSRLSSTTFPPSGEARAAVVSFELPEDASCLLSFNSNLTDLSGNPLSPSAFEFLAGKYPSRQVPSITGIQPAAGIELIPLNAVFTLQFSVPMNAASVTNAIVLSVNGYTVPAAIAPSGSTQSWTITPNAPFPSGASVKIHVGATAFSESGLALSWPYSVQYQTVSEPTTATILSALRATPSFIDLRFSAPTSQLPEEPFGLRLHFARVPASITRMGPAWYRLTPDTPLDPAQPYVLMAGPNLEIPLALTEIQPPPESAASPTVTRDDSGRLTLHFETPIDPFRIDTESTALLDLQGRAIPHAARLSTDGRTLVLEPLTSVPFHQLHWQGRATSIRPPAGRPER